MHIKYKFTTTKKKRKQKLTTVTMRRYCCRDRDAFYILGSLFFVIQL
uniref:Uncharacterized protein n=1 Tax=Anguilla anguilla TaxID=7936 RepID=A0A0E9RDY5_ANGAN